MSRWRFGQDTHQIAVVLRLHEADVEKIITQDRERRRGLEPAQFVAREDA